MNKNVAISIIVPVYNVEKYLHKCIGSILNQTFTDYELLLIDDGSTDQSGEICDAYALKDTRIKVVHQKNGGVSAARNEAISLAQGSYIGFVDADDTIDPTYFEKLISTAMKKDYDLVICGFQTISISANKQETIRYKYGYDFAGNIDEFLSHIPAYMQNSLIQGPCNKLFKAEIIKTNDILFPLTMSFGEDTIFVYTFLAQAKNVASMKECLYFYSQLEQTSLSSVFREDKLDIYLSLYEALNSLLSNHHVDLGRENKFFIEQGKCGAFVSCIRQLYVKKPKFNKKYRLEQIKIMVAKVEDVFATCRNDDKQAKLLYHFISEGNISAIDRYFKVKELVRNKFAWLYGKMKRLNN